MVVSNVTAAKPKVSGAVFAAPVGSTLPTAVGTTLDTAFKELGYISEDGLTNGNSPESTTIKAWGGDTVLTIQTSKEDTFGFTLIEALNLDVLKTIYGTENVSGSLSNGITINANSKELQEQAYVIDMILRDGTLKRIVIPDAAIGEIAEITYSDSDAVGYGVTLNAMPDAAGNTHYEYIKAA